MSLPAFDAFDRTQPEAFYLGDPSGEFASLSDVEIVARGDIQLMAHSHVLAQHSGVLRSVLAAEAESEVSAQPVQEVGAWHAPAPAHHDQEGARKPCIPTAW